MVVDQQIFSTASSKSPSFLLSQRPKHACTHTHTLTLLRRKYDLQNKIHVLRLNLSFLFFSYHSLTSASSFNCISNNILNFFYQIKTATKRTESVLHNSSLWDYFYKNFTMNIQTKVAAVLYAFHLHFCNKVVWFINTKKEKMEIYMYLYVEEHKLTKKKKEC